MSGINLGLDPAAYLDAIDPALVGEIHVAGHSVEQHEGGALIAIDDHGSSVSEQCWTLLDCFIARAGPKPVLVERDNDVPAFADLAAEVARADSMLAPRLSYAA